MFSGRTLLLLGLGLFLCLTTLVATAAGLLRPAVNFPLPVASYHDQQIPSLFGKLTGRIQREPLNLVATIVFLGAIGIILSNLLYLTVFRREFARLATNIPDEEQKQEGSRPIPWRITGIHILFLCWTVANAHYPVLVILGLLFFLAFVSATRLNQHAIALRPPLLVGFFLAALIIHGGCQEWWIAPVLGSLSKWPLMIGATILTAFNDNAAITYLASLVPGFSDVLKYVVMAGAVTGGG